MMNDQPTTTNGREPRTPVSGETAAHRGGVLRADGLAAVLLVALVGVFVFFASRRLDTIPAPLGDEPWLMQTASEFIRHGSLGLPMFRLVGGNIEHVWMTMPGLFLSLAAFFKAFGVGLEQARAYNVTAACVLLVTVFLIGRKLHSRAAGLLAVFVLAFDANFFHIARIFRNDIPTVACAMSAFYFYLRAQSAATRRWQWRWALLAGFLASLSVLIHPNGIYMFGVIFVWSLVEQGVKLFRSHIWWAFVAGALVLAVPCGVYVALHYADFIVQWHPDSVHYRGTTATGFWKNVTTEYMRYQLWRASVLAIATPDSRAVSFFQLGVVLSGVYLILRTMWTISRTELWHQFLSRVRSWTPSGQAMEADRAQFYELSEEEKRTSGSFQVWMLRQGGWRRRLTLALHGIEEESRPVTTWLDALGSPSHPAWRASRAGLVVVTLATLAFFAMVDTQKSPSYLPYTTAWYGLCGGVAIVDGIRWGVGQRKRSARRVLMGIGVLLVVLVPTLWYMGSSSRAVWRFYRWSRTFDPAPYSDLATVLGRVVPPDVIPVGRPVHWLAFPENNQYLSANKRIWKQGIMAQPSVLIVDQGLMDKENFLRPFEKHVESFTLLAELSNTLYGDIKVYYTGQDGRFRNHIPEHYYFFGDYRAGYGRKGYYSEEQRQSAKVIWLAGPTELERVAKANAPPGDRPPSVQLDGERSALRIVTDVSSYNTRVRLPFVSLKPYTLYRLQTAVRVSEGGCLVGPRDQTGLWLTEPSAIDPGKQYTPVDMVFATNARGDGELAVSNRRNRPAASLIYLGQVELREIGPRP